jgi:hypothetical protein
MSAFSALAGKVRVRPGQNAPLGCDRPVMRDGVLGSLLRGFTPAQVPDLLAAVFTLCADAHRLTALRALRAARGDEPGPEERTRERSLLHALTLREHTLRLGLDLPLRTKLCGVVTDARWLSGLPGASGMRVQEPEELSAALREFLADRLWGMPASQWRLRFPGTEGVQAFADERAGAHPLCGWLSAAAALGRSMPLLLRPLPAPTCEATLARLGTAMAQEPHFCARPEYRAAAAETGPWARALPATGAGTWERDVWDLLAARMQELAALATGEVALAHGAVRLGDGEAVAFTEMSRGLVLHWVKLRAASLPAGATVVEDYRVVAPTEWNFHPAGALASELSDPSWEGQRLRLLVQAFDPCVDVDMEDGRAAEGLGDA